MRRAEYSFTPGYYISFPSSLQLVSDEPLPAWSGWYNAIRVKPRSTVKTAIYVRQENVEYYPGGLSVHYYASQY